MIRDKLKLLVDAVQSSKFITKEKTESLIRKLEKQTSTYNAAQLQRQVFIYTGRPGRFYRSHKAAPITAANSARYIKMCSSVFSPWNGSRRT